MTKTMPRKKQRLWFDYFAREEEPDLPLPPEPTEHLACSPEKIALIQWRIANGYQLYHPLDAKGKYVTSQIDLRCVTIVGNVFRVRTHRTVEGKRTRFEKTFAILDEALDWLDWLNENYPVR